MFRFVVPIFLSLLSFIPLSHATEVNISGSTSVARVMDALADQYNQTHTHSFIAVQGIGSTAGITMVNKDVVELGMSSRYLTESEKGEDLNVELIAYDGLAVVVNRANSISNLSQDQLYNIYKGNITNWKQVGGEDKPIAAVTRESSSGTRYSFESLLGLTRILNERLVSDINPSNLVVNSNSMVKTIVNHNPHAIGFVSLGSVDGSVKAVSIDGIVPNAENIKNHAYLLSRPFLILYKVGKIDKDAKAFVNFIKSKQGQEIIENFGYISVIKKEE